jgi:hypothetical protein
VVVGVTEGWYDNAVLGRGVVAVDAAAAVDVDEDTTGCEAGREVLVVLGVGAGVPNTGRIMGGVLAWGCDGSNCEGVGAGLVGEGCCCGALSGCCCGCCCEAFAGFAELASSPRVNTPGV